MARLVLASASPRRKELLARLGVRFDVRPVDIAEDAGSSKDPQILARRLARAKAEAARLSDEHAPILAADTVVALDGRIFGKPADAGQAREMLRTLRGLTRMTRLRRQCAGTVTVRLPRAGTSLERRTM